ncbi:Putative membrane protein [Thermococcus nautili]|uniref:DUF2101 family protein n=1 Tax=Thermococcus nautili TaxID=195522 RepID=UPI0025534C13|nr:DUF2101 family protein [Thermococcus nautili]CAI1492405.1 Putative membrane protein [Thermococcus nautili]
MAVDEFLYSIGEGVERIASAFRSFLFPEPSENPPRFGFTRRLVKSRVTLHELFSLHLQLCFLLYLVLNFVVVFLVSSPLWVLILAVPYFLYLRYIFNRYGHFLLEEKPYRVFYTVISALSFLAFFGYSIVRLYAGGVLYVYAYVMGIAVLVLLFRWYFKRTFGRDYTYGVVEELKGDLVRVFVHDDLSANVKPGLYWLPAVPDAEPGRVVKVLVEDRAFRSAKPVRIIEVYLSQSSQSSTEPKNAME